jgi:hypothetical protein
MRLTGEGNIGLYQPKHPRYFMPSPLVRIFGHAWDGLIAHV